MVVDRGLDPPCPSVGFLVYGLDRPLSGITRYAVELARALADHSDKVKLTLLKPFTGAATGLDELYPVARIRGRLLPSLMLVAPSQVVVVSRRHKLRAIHDPMGISPFLVPRRLAWFGRVVTIHDMIPFVFPETHAPLTNLLFRYYIPRTLRFVDQILTVSEAAKQDIVRFFGVASTRISVIPNGVSEQFNPTPSEAGTQVRNRIGIPEDYVLSVGALQDRKNLGVVFEAYAALRARGIHHRLVVVGKKAWKYEKSFRRLSELGLGGDVIFTGYVQDEDLPDVYRGAAAFVFPSLYEGFGLPPLEAMACGVPVITSNSSSLPEVVGDAGITLDPHDARGFSEALESVLGNDDMRRGMRARGIQRAAQYTWERAARSHVMVYERVAERYLASATSDGAR